MRAAEPPAVRRCLSPAACRRLRLASPVVGGILELMGGASTVLTSVRNGDLWRVQIEWPSGTTKCFGKFGSEQEATEWIGRHRWLTERAFKDTKINRPWGSVSGRKVVVDVLTGQIEAGETAPE